MLRLKTSYLGNSAARMRCAQEAKKSGDSAPR